MSQSQDLRKSPSSNSFEPPALWTVPYRRNPFFTGREALLAYLHSHLVKTKATALTQTQAINGLGGIGKTQTAVEYAYRCRDEYHSVIWIRAATRDTLITDFVGIANRLQLPEKDEQDQMIAVAAVKRWLTEQRDWLLILDNADNLDVIGDFLPTGDTGHVLITTRAQAVGSIAQDISVEKMDEEEGALLLLRRAKVLAVDASLDQATETDQRQAAEIVAAMDGLPLAIDQAGAYIEETRCGLSSYLDRYHMHQKELLQWRGASPTDYPESVTTTWSLSFQRIEQTNRGAADLLRLCSFLDPDEIPEEIFIQGAPDLGPTLMSIAANALKLDQAIGQVLQYSLMKRNEKAKMLSIHRLVQAVLKARMSQKIQKLWAERAIRAVNHTLPDIEEATLSLGQRLLPHAQECAALIEYYAFVFPEAAQLLIWTGSYLIAHAENMQEELLSQRVSKVQEEMLGATHIKSANSLDRLDSLYIDQVRDKEARPLYERALAICEQVLGPEHPSTAVTLYTLATLFRRQGKYKEAEPLYLRALAIREQVFGPEHPRTAIILHELGLLYWAQGRYKEAESLLQHTLAIREQAFGSEHLGTTNILLDLGKFYENLGRYKEAEQLYLRALMIREQAFGLEHVNIAAIFHLLGLLDDDQGRYQEAKSRYEQALKIYVEQLGSTHPVIATTLNDLGWLYSDQRRYHEATHLHQRALLIREQVLGPEHLDVAIGLRNLGRFYRQRSRYKEAEQLLRRALAIRERVLGPEHPAIADIFDNLGWLYHDKGRYQEAEQMFKRTLTIYEQILGPEHLKTARSKINVAWIYQLQGRYQEAEHLLRQALTILERVLGPEHRNTAEALNDLGWLYDELGRYREAEQLHQRALTICKQVLGPAHYIVGGMQGSYAIHLLRRGRIVKSLLYGVRGLKILGLKESVHYIWIMRHAYLKRAIRKRSKNIYPT